MRLLLCVFVAALLCPSAAFADDLTLTPGNPTSDGVPTTVTASGSANPSSQGRVSVFRLVSNGSGCPGTYSSASAQGVALDSGHMLTASGPFSFEDQNGGTHDAGTSYLLCGYLETPSGTTVAQTSPYTVPGGGPPPGTAAPTVTTGEGSDSGPAGSTMFGTIKPNGLDTTYRIDYGTTTAYGQSVAGPGAVGGTVTMPQQVSVTIPPLPAGTTIHYRLAGTNAAGESLGADRVYTTPGGIPTVTTGAADHATYDGFTLHGSFNPHGHDRAMFEYTLAPVGTARTYSELLPQVGEEDAGSENAADLVVPYGFLEYYYARWPEAESFGNGTFPVIKPTITIAYRLVVGASEGEWKTITSPAPTRAPTVVTGGAKGVICGDVGKCLMLSGTVDDHGQGFSYTAFEVGPTASYGQFCGGTAVHSDKDGNVIPYTGQPALVTGIYCATPYFQAGSTVHYRLAAGNGGPAVFGADRTFTVPGTPPAAVVREALEEFLQGRAPRIGKLLQRGGYQGTFSAPSAGVVKTSWSYVWPSARRPRGAPRTVPVGAGGKDVDASGEVPVKVTLTRQGKALLRTVKPGATIQIKVKGSFTPKGGEKITKRDTILLKR